MVKWSKVNDFRNGKWGENLKFEIGDWASISAILGVIKSTKVNNLS